MTNTSDMEDDNNERALKELEEKITDMKEEAQRNPATKDKDDEAIKNLNDALQKATSDNTLDTAKIANLSK